ncbi:prepilin-type N-terminal cleavage/methylation domain-containing protein [Pseudohongiella sp. O18]|uniref:prepilin-type N-terminal cleavage/methylation domain-containing protein n=1 Tax=Pseudohongiella sp. O18 TaxID=2904248 RepID=UPI001F388816|nr:prepilin-type N-terminal cleavage/methylation domain-containing protein [Pseudohongiella sp. O18]
MHKNSPEAGFTITEIVIVIVLVGIIAALGMSRILRSDTYNAIIVRDQVVSLSRSAQQRAIGRSDVVLTLRPVGSNLEVEVEDDNGVMQRATLGLDSVLLSADVNELDSCGSTTGSTTLTTSNELVFEFDELGDLLRGGVTGSPGYPVTVTNGARLCIDNDPLMSVCWSTSGYAYVGDCIE